jgi:hypothetical protein
VHNCIRYRRDITQDDGVEVTGYSRGILPNLNYFACYVDASFAGDADTRRSSTGYIFKIAGGPVSWQSRMQTSVALSSMESEYMAASAVAQKAMWHNRLIGQLGFNTPHPITLFEDNKAAILFAADHPVYHRRSQEDQTY